MDGKLLMFILILGLAAALPTKNFNPLRIHKSTGSDRGLGIFDGTATTIAKHNYLVGLIQDGNEFYCAGAILSESYVLTSAYCAHALSASDITVVAGSNDGYDGTSYPVKEIITHPNFDYYSYSYTLLKIKGTFSWGDDVGNATLPSAEPKSGAALVAAGWGDTVNQMRLLGTVGSGTLKQGTMKYMPYAHCEKFYKGSDLKFDSSMACAYNKGKVTMCLNDFGNPLTKGNVLYGLVICLGSKFCTSSADPVVIADVFTVVDWINKYISS